MPSAPTSARRAVLLGASILCSLPSAAGAAPPRATAAPPPPLPAQQTTSPSTLTSRALANLVAFARLYGYVRFFHPSDEAAAADWNAVAVTGVQKVEGATTASDLVRALDEVFKPLAPTLRIYPTGSARPPLPRELSPPKVQGAAILSWEHHGVSLEKEGFGRVFTSERQARPPAEPGLSPSEPLLSDLGAGVSAAIPLAVYRAARRTLPHPAGREGDAGTATSPQPSPPSSDRAVRLADVVIAWNVLQHFYPYFDVVKTDWPAELPKALTAAATDADGKGFLTTLSRLAAALHDGHAMVIGPGTEMSHRLPLLWDWVEDQLVVTAVSASGAEGVARGDVVTRIGGRPAAEVVAEREALTSAATPQLLHKKALITLLTGAPDDIVPLEVRHPDGQVATFALKRSVPFGDPEGFVENGLQKIQGVRPGIVYVDLSRIDDDDLKAAFDLLSSAQGIVFDVRTFVSVSWALFSHLIDEPYVTPPGAMPIVTLPDRKKVALEPQSATIREAAPHFRAKVAFLSSGGAFSAAETYLAIAEDLQLGPIVGGPSGGTNGNMNRLRLPSGYLLFFTGTRVARRDGSPLMGAGIRPTVPVRRTIAGVAAGRDEILEKAIDLLNDSIGRSQ